MSQSSVIDIYHHDHIVLGAEIDELGHAGNTRYVRWMQDAAVAHSTANGWSPERYREQGRGWVVRSHRITYLRPAFESDVLVIRTWVANMRSAVSLRQYEITHEDGTVLARAETDWAFVDYDRQSPVRIPAELASSFIIVTPESFSL